MRLTHKYRLFPTSAQRAALNRTLDSCLRLYHEPLHVRKQAWEERGDSLSRYDTIKLLPQWKQDAPWLSEAYSQTLQAVCSCVDLFLRPLDG